MAVLVIAALGFVALAVAAHSIAYFGVDLAITRLLQDHRNPALDAILEWVSWPGFPPQSNVVFGTLIVLLLVSRRFVAAAVEVLAAGGSAALWFGIAPLVARPRPSSDLVYVSIQIHDGSFPSGHVFNLGAGLGFAWFLALTILPHRWWRTVILWLVPLYLVVLGVARIYSGQHWASDVLGGYLIAGLWLWVCVSIYRVMLGARTQ